MHTYVLEHWIESEKALHDIGFLDSWEAIIIKDKIYQKFDISTFSDFIRDHPATSQSKKTECTKTRMMKISYSVRTGLLVFHASTDRYELE